MADSSNDILVHPETVRPISVLFVCLGNICRSPMAEAVFRSLTAGNNKIGHIDSCGTIAYHRGDAPDPRTMSALAKHGITDYEHEARKLEGDDFVKFNYILAMDKDNLRDLQKMRNRVLVEGGTVGPWKCMLFGDFGGRKGEQVNDPYYGRVDGFEEAYEQMIRFSKGLIEEIDNDGWKDPRNVDGNWYPPK